MKCYRSLLFPVVVLAIAGQARAISCPGTGSKIRVIINNPTTTTGQTGTIRGDVISGQQTCVGQAISYMQGFTLTQTGDNEFIVPASGGVNSGMWKHQITAGSQAQFQQTPVVFTSDANEYATVRWTYHPVVIQVNQAGDTGPGTCVLGNPCTFRDALNTANGLLPLTTSPILIEFNLSPGTMTQSADLVIGNSAYSNIITIDGTDSNGDPWIVGDALAAAQGSQDPFTRVVDLNNTTKFRIDGPNVTVKGLGIINTVPAGQNNAKVLIEGTANNTRIEALQIDAGAKGTCTPTIDDCSDGVNHVISLRGSGSLVQNVEGRSAFGRGVEISGSAHEVRDSWFHHNYVDNIGADDTTISRNFLELGGRRASDNQVVFHDADGIFPFEGGDFETHRNVIRNHPGVGIEVTATLLEPVLSDDYTCGNDQLGVEVNGGGTSRVRSSGLAAVYNGGHGVQVKGGVTGGSLNFDDDSAFASNGTCGFLNSTGFTVSANNNQWRGATTSCTQSADLCSGGGPVTCSTIQDGADLNMQLSATQPTFPRNVMLKGQTIRVQGTLFNAITGNPLNTDPAASCTLGNETAATNCCRRTAKANVCGSGSPPAAPMDGSQCVALRNGANQWKVLPVTSVTPTTIATEITDGVFVCTGGLSEVVRVSKLTAGGPIARQGVYCANMPPL